MPRHPAAISIASARTCSAMTPSAARTCPLPDGILQAVPDWRDLTSDPRKYGFHATLKAPMSLAPGKTEAELLAACAAFAATPRAIPVIRPVVGSIEGFIARDSGGAAAGADPACGRLRQRIRFVPRAAHRRGSCAAQSFAIDAGAARASRSLGISLCDGRFPFSHDADGPARHRAPRTLAEAAGGSLCRARTGDICRSTGSPCSGRTSRLRDSGSSSTGSCAQGMPDRSPPSGGERRDPVR